MPIWMASWLPNFFRNLDLHPGRYCPDCRVVFDTLAKAISLHIACSTTCLMDLPNDVEERLMHRLNLAARRQCPLDEIPLVTVLIVKDEEHHRATLVYNLRRACF